MRKTDKKIDKQLRLVLTEVCDSALEEVDGFQWLTHVVNYSIFPKSLKVICVFDTNEQLSAYTTNSYKRILTASIQAKLNEIGIKINNVADHILYDTEENCAKGHNGNWANRLS